MKTKPSGCLSALASEFKALRALDDRNQRQYTRTQLKPKLTKAQMCLLSEGLFFAAFRAYEQFLRNVFLLYCCGAQSSGRKLVRSFLQPKTVPHAEILLKSAMPFVDWSSPDTLITRAEAYLKDGYPIKTPVSSNLDTLRTLKKVRNHIAHMSGAMAQDWRTRVHAGMISGEGVPNVPINPPNSPR